MQSVKPHVCVFMSVLFFAVYRRWCGFPSRWSAQKNNSKRSTILQHLLAKPHQQMLQNSSTLEIKGGVVRRAMRGWEIVAEMMGLLEECTVAWNSLHMEERNGKCHLNLVSPDTGVTLLRAPPLTVKNTKKIKWNFYCFFFFSENTATSHISNILANQQSQEDRTDLIVLHQ